jgi:elongation factor Ts
LEQPFIKQSDRTVKDVVQEAIARLGENVTVRRFARFQLGESQERRAQEDKSADRTPADQKQADKETPAGGAPGA